MDNTIWVSFITGLTAGGLSCFAVQGGVLSGVIAQRVDAVKVPVSKFRRKQKAEVKTPLQQKEVLQSTLLFLAARAQIVAEVIRPHLAQGGLVLSDRYGDSTLAYQGYGHGADIPTLRQLLEFATQGLKPDLTLLMDLDIAEGLRRRRGGGGEWNRLDAYPVEFHERVRRGYHQLAAEEPRRWVIIDAARPPEQVQCDLRAAILNRLEKQPARPTCAS